MKKPDRKNTGDIFALTPMQAGMLTHYLKNPGSSHYFEQLILDIRGEINRGLFKKAWNFVVQTNEMLRTVFHWEKVSQPVQVVLKRYISQVDYYDFSNINPAEKKKNIEKLKQDDRNKKFNLASVPLRIILSKIEKDSYLLIISNHHILYDGWSNGIILRELFTAYNNLKEGKSPVPPTKNKFKEFVKWMGNQDSNQQESFWKDYLHDFATKTVLPIKRKKEHIKQNIKTHKVRVSTGIKGQLEKFVKESRLTLSSILYGIWGILLHRYCNCEDVVFGTTVSGRSARVKGISEIVGLFINTIPLRIRCHCNKPILELLEQVNTTLQRREKFENTPLVSIKKYCQWNDKEELFDSILVIENYPLERHLLRHSRYLSPDSYSIFASTPYDLTVSISIFDHIEISYIYNSDIFTGGAAIIERLANHFVHVLEMLITNHHQELLGLDILPVKEKKRLLYQFNDTDASYPGGKTIHQLFAGQVQVVPDRVAVVDPARAVHLTYCEVNRKSNQLAQLLRQKGVGPDAIVGIMTEPTTETVIGLLSILKAGGAYLPIDPGYPGARIDYMLKDSNAVILLENNSIKYVSSFQLQTLNSVSSNLAYVIYTSGTTGNPKGVLVQHNNVVRLLFNHRFSFDFNETDNWTLFHSFCFDFSVWEMYGALLYGGRLIPVPGMTARHPGQFRDILRKNCVTILNQTPSAFYNLIREELNHKREELNIRYVIFGGEALKPQKLKEWQEKYPGTILVNMYGITETCVHVTEKVIGEQEIKSNMSNIGKPIPTIRTYIMDQYQRLQPIGIPGELMVGGDGLARGYLNQPALTAAKFFKNPYKPGERLYKSGDRVRMLADGQMEYLGRIDQQVQLRGFRIELGEIENQLLTHIKIKDTVVILAEDPGGHDYLCAYMVIHSPVYSDSLDTSHLRQYLADKLPGYMIPSYFVIMEKFPLTSNGKIDRSALPVPREACLVTGRQYKAPGNIIEVKLVEIWEKVLGRKSIGITDDFFTIGGDSIKAIQILSQMSKCGYTFEMKDLFQYPSISALAPRVKKYEVLADQSTVTGIFPLTPIQEAFSRNPDKARHHFNQAIMLFSPEGFNEDGLREVFKKIQVHHDALRMRYREEKGKIVQENHGLDHPLSLEVYDFRDRDEINDAYELLEANANKIQRSIDLQNGPLMKIRLFHLNDGDRLLIVIHHLVVDGVSWRILLEDFETLYSQYKRGESFALPAKTDSFKVWAEKLAEYASSPSLAGERVYWQAVESTAAADIKRDFFEDNENKNCVKDTGTLGFRLSEEDTELLLTKVNDAFSTEINDILLTGLALSIPKINRTVDNSRLVLWLEGHGREHIFENVDISRTMGWFTTIYPVVLDLSYANDPARQIKEVKETLRRVPNRGIGYGILKYLTAAGSGEGIDFRLSPRISFNYLGQFDADLEGVSFKIAEESTGDTQSLSRERECDLEVWGLIVNKRLTMSITYNSTRYKPETIRHLLNHYEIQLRQIIYFCSAREKREQTPGDFTYKELSIDELETIKTNAAGDIEDIYPLSPMQEGMLFHSLAAPTSLAYFEQISYRFNGKLNIDIVEKTFNELVKRHEVLRTMFVYEGIDRPVQVVLAKRSLDFYYEDLRGKLPGIERNSYIEAYRQNRQQGLFDLTKDVLMRVSVFQWENEGYDFVWNYHHILMDGWCIGILMTEYVEIYNSFLEGRKTQEKSRIPYRQYIQWLESRDKNKSLRYWSDYLKGYSHLATIPRGSRAANNNNKEGYKKSSVEIELDKQTMDCLNQLAGYRHVTLNTIFQAIWGIILGKYNGREDVVFGAVVSGRPQEIAGVDTMVGLFINTIPVRITYKKEMKFYRLLQKVQEQAIESGHHCYYPLAEILPGIAVKQNIPDHIFIFENYPMPDRMEGITNIKVFEQSNFDLNIVVLLGRRRTITFEYNALVYEKDWLETVMNHFKRVTDQVLKNDTQAIGDLTLLSETEREQILYDFNDTGIEYPKDLRVHELFLEQCQKAPDKVVVVGAGAGLEHIILTGKELNRKASQLARVFREKGMQPGTIVGLLVGRSLKMILGVLAILKSGAAYLPIDPGYPAERIKYMLLDSGAGFLVSMTGEEKELSRESHLYELFEKIEVLQLDKAMNDSITLAYRQVQQAGIARPNHPVRLLDHFSTLCYVIYTSGSSGRPKGVMVDHENIIRLVKDPNYIHFETNDRLLMTGVLVFDISTFEIWVSLVNGIPLHTADENILLDAGALKGAVIKNKITILHLVPQLFSQMAARCIEIFSGLRYLLVGGDLVKPEFLNKVRKKYKKLKILHMYGPTENATFTTFFKVKHSYETSIPIGRPINNTTVFIVEKSGDLAAIGELGELWTGGEGVARGYINKPELTAKRFANLANLETIATASSGKKSIQKLLQKIAGPGGETTRFLEKSPPGRRRLYKTGDLARWQPDGNLCFLGRIDHQVKVRGQRLELGEIEARLLKHRKIKDTVVIAKETGQLENETQLYAYIVPYSKEAEVTAEELKRFLSGELPAYMLPTYFIKLDKLPLNPNGKIDRQALMSPGMGTALNPAIEYKAPGNETEKSLVRLWQEVLHRDKIGINDNFFDIGGTSLSIIRLSGRLKEVFPRDIPVVTLFNYPTIGLLARYLAGGDKGEGEEKEVEGGEYPGLKEDRILPAVGNRGLDTAVIGMAGRFPGARTIDEFRDNIIKGIESISFFTEQESVIRGADAEDVNKPGYVAAKGVLKGKECFDASFFDYTAAEASVMEPQVRVFHECCWEALENAAYDPGTYKGIIGLYAGSSTNPSWDMLSLLSIASSNTYAEQWGNLQLSDRNFLTTRIGYKLNLKGPCVTVQTACSTSLVAIDLACQGLLSRKCDIALAGGVSITFHDEGGYFYQEGMILSPDGHCRAFDTRAKGTVSGNGAGVVVLKRLGEALEDGDNIRAVIKGISINNDGLQKVGFTAPGIEGQAAVIRGALQMAGVSPETIAYIEAHGTGTPLGDPVETEALCQAFGTDKRHPCALGSVKSNIGHLDAAAGVAGFIKTVLTLEHRLIPPSLHFETPNLKLALHNTRFYINAKPVRWENRGVQFRAAVSSFGIGGTNAHVILEEWLPAPGAEHRRDNEESKKHGAGTRDYQLLLFSAKTAAALHKMTENLSAYFKKNPGIDPADAAYTLQVGRRHFQHRKIVVCSDSKEMISRFTSTDSAYVHTSAAPTANPPVVFMFPGQGSQYVNMGQQLYEKEPVFRETMNRCFEHLKPLIGYDVREILYPDTGSSLSLIGKKIDRTEITQPVLFIFEYALAQLLIKWGIKPFALIGHSIGEYTAACLSGVFSFKDALKLVVLRGKLMQRRPGGTMLSVSLPEEELTSLLKSVKSPLSLAAVNSPSNCVVSGQEQAVKSFERHLTANGCKSRRIHTSHGFHSEMMEPILAEFEIQVSGVKLKPPKIPFISNVSGTFISQQEAMAPGYWGTQLRRPVRFAGGLKKLAADGNTLLIEVGPGNVLSTFARQGFPTKPAHTIINLIRHPREKIKDDAFLVTQLGRLWLAGAQINWLKYHGEVKRHRIPLPSYPFESRPIFFKPDIKAVDISRILENASRPFLALSKDGAIDEKSEKSAVAADSQQRAGLSSSYKIPGNLTQQTLVEIWQRFFGFEPIGILDDFFELGGDSLKAVTLGAVIQKKLNLAVPVSEFFKNPTIKEFSQYLTSADAAKEQYFSIEPVEQKEYYPLSSVQERLYALQQLDKQSTPYNMAMILEIEGEANRKLWENIFLRLIDRHESLRTSFHLIDNQPVQRIHDTVGFEVEYFDLAVKNQKEVENKIKGFIKPFDLSHAPLLRVGIFTAPGSFSRENEGSCRQCILVVDMHHIISDAISIDILIQEFRLLYSGEILSPPGLRYRDFCQWQSDRTGSEFIKKQAVYWGKQFAAGIPVLDLPTDFPRPAVQEFAGSRFTFEISREDTISLKALGWGKNLTLFMVLAAAVNIFLSKLANQEDIVVGTPVANRTHADLGSIIGMFVNTLPLRNQPSGAKNLYSFLEEIKVNILGAFENQHYPFENLVEQLEINRDVSRNPLFDVMFLLQDIDMAGIDIESDKPGQAPDLILKPYGFDTKTSKFDLSLEANQGGETLLFTCEYSTRLFKPSTIQAFSRYFKKILSEIAGGEDKRIYEIEIIPVDQKKQILTEFNGVETEYPRDKTIGRIFTDRARETPDFVALVGPKLHKTDHLLDTMAITYRELNKKSDEMAFLLKEKGVEAGSIVGIMVERSLEMIIGLIGILKADAAYLPIDPGYPRDRIDFMLADSGARVVLTEENHFYCQKYSFDKQSPPNTKPAIAYLEATPVTSPAYIMYTSGSTGRPKGVIVNHGNVVRLVMHSNYIRLEEHQRLLLTGSIAFDITTFEIWGSLLNGLSLYLVEQEITLDAVQLKGVLFKQNISILHLIPQLFHQLAAREPDMFSRLRYLLVGGDLLRPDTINRLRKKHKNLEILHMYGPTENTTFSTFLPIKRDYETRLPIGIPISNTTVYILDRHHCLQPVLIPGELCTGGDGTAVGYLNQPGLTAEKFCRRRQKIYKTGDMARWLPDGNIEFFGRIDRQIKIRGFRVEPGEIVERLLKHESVEQAVVVAKETKNDKYLCAYITVFKEVSPSDLKEYLAGVLPHYMIPAYFITLDRIPLTANRKVDIHGLPEPGINEPGENYIPPGDEIEKKLVEIWAEVLGIEKDVISIDANFFQLGGHSLKGTLLAGKIHEKLNVRLPLAELFRQPCIRGISTYIKNIKKTAENKFHSIEAVEKREYYNMSHAQQRFWVMDRLEENQVVYNITLAYWFKGALDRRAFEKAFETLTARHEILRTRFVLVGNEPKQRIYDARQIGFKVQYHDLRNRENPGHTAMKLAEKEKQTPFNLEKGPFWRAALLHVKNQEYVFLFSMHHIISDGWSLSVVLINEFLAMYGKYTQSIDSKSFLPVLRIQYKDYTAWHNRRLSSENLVSHRHYWLDQFKGEVPQLKLPTDYPRPLIRAFNGGRIHFVLEQRLKEQLTTISQNNNVTLFMTLLAAVNALLFDYTGQEDIIIGSPIAGRLHRDLENQVGCYLNTLALRIRFNAGDSFEYLLAIVKTATLKAYEHEIYPFDSLVDVLKLERKSGRNPLFDVMAVLQNIDGSSGTADYQLQGRENESLHFSDFNLEIDTSTFDLNFTFEEREETILLILKYNSDLYEESSIGIMGETFIQVIEKICRDSSIRVKEIAREYRPGKGSLKMEEWDIHF